MFRDMGQVATDALAATLLEASTAALDAMLREGAYVGYLAIADSDRVLAGAGAHIPTQLPRVSEGGMGMARALMNTLMEWATPQRYDRLTLHASDAGRALYQSLGFKPTNEMRWSPNSVADRSV
jgi:GNAT superfamily N-acetyltransferase